MEAMGIYPSEGECSRVYCSVAADNIWGCRDDNYNYSQWLLTSDY